MTRPRYLPASAVFIAMTALLGLGYAAFGPKTHKVLAQGGILPVGSYGFLVKGSPVAPASPIGAVGVINFDGAGGVTGSYTSYDPSSSTPVQTGTFTGTYSSNGDGTGSFTIVTSGGDTEQYAMVVANSNAQISFLQTSASSGITDVVTGVATLR